VQNSSLGGVIGSAMFSITSAVGEFTDQRQKLDDAAAARVALTTDSKPQLAELYQPVVRDEPGLTATIEENGNVLFEHPELGGFFISLNAERHPET